MLPLLLGAALVIWSSRFQLSIWVSIRSDSCCCAFIICDIAACCKGSRGRSALALGCRAFELMPELAAR
jgi:hypothetical protein